MVWIGDKHWEDLNSSNLWEWVRDHLGERVEREEKNPRTADNPETETEKG